MKLAHITCGEIGGCGSTHDSIGEGLDVFLGRRQPDPNRAHQDGQANIHGNANSVCDDIAVGLDQRAVDEGERDHQWIGFGLGLDGLAGGLLGADLGDFLVDGLLVFGLCPAVLKMSKPPLSLVVILGKVRVDHVNDELGRIRIHWRWVTQVSKILGDAGDQAVVHGAALREKEQLVKQLKGGS